MRHDRPRRSIECVGDAIRLERVSKPGGGSRTIAHLGERDRRLYEAAVAAVLPSVERSLTPGVVANRAVRTATGLELESWMLARLRYTRALRAASKGPGRAVFLGDVRDCYGSITPATVQRALCQAGVSPGRAEWVAVLLQSFESRGVRGLPIGPTPSAVLANAVLAPVDTALREAGEGRAYRWVDDVVVFTSDAASSRRARAAFERALAAIGLQAHPGKCRVVDELPAALPHGSSPSL